MAGPPLRPEIERNFEYLDEYDTDAAGFLELAVLLEDAIDIHDRHWKIHWMLNFAQFASTQALNALLEEKGEAAGRADGAPPGARSPTATGTRSRISGR